MGLTAIFDEGTFPIEDDNEKREVVSAEILINSRLECFILCCIEGYKVKKYNA
jgi:hypothetical protein